MNKTDEFSFLKIMQCKERTISSIYKILTKICENNIENSSYIFNYLPFIFYQVFSKNKNENDLLL